MAVAFVGGERPAPVAPCFAGAGESSMHSLRHAAWSMPSQVCASGTATTFTCATTWAGWLAASLACAARCSRWISARRGRSSTRARGSGREPFAVGDQDIADVVAALQGRPRATYMTTTANVTTSGHDRRRSPTCRGAALPGCRDRQPRRAGPPRRRSAVSARRTPPRTPRRGRTPRVMRWCPPPHRSRAPDLRLTSYPVRSVDPRMWQESQLWGSDVLRPRCSRLCSGTLRGM